MLLFFHYGWTDHILRHNLIKKKGNFITRAQGHHKLQHESEHHYRRTLKGKKYITTMHMTTTDVLRRRCWQHGWLSRPCPSSILKLCLAHHSRHGVYSDLIEKITTGVAGTRFWNNVLCSSAEFSRRNTEPPRLSGQLSVNLMPCCRQRSLVLIVVVGLVSVAVEVSFTIYYNNSEHRLPCGAFRGTSSTYRTLRCVGIRGTDIA